MNLYQLTEVQLIVFALVLLRVIAFCFSSAVISSNYVNIPTRVLLSLAISMCIYSTVVVKDQTIITNSENLIYLSLINLVAGLIIGFMTRLFFFVVGMVGDLVSLSLGLNSAQMYNPMLNSQGGVLEQFYVMLGTLFFFLLNGHHVLISALAYSFQTLSIDSMTLHTGGLAEVAYWGREVLVIALKMSAPVLIAIFLANVVMGVIGRAIPQMNVLVTSFPVTMLLGVGVIFVCMPLFVVEMNGVIEMTSEKLMLVVKSL